jgi:hypothetical protein
VRGYGRSGSWRRRRFRKVDHPGLLKGKQESPDSSDQPRSGGQKAR